MAPAELLNHWTFKQKKNGTLQEKPTCRRWLRCSMCWAAVKFAQADDRLPRGRSPQK